MDFKYNCYIPYYLEMESGIIPVPKNSKDGYIVVEPQEGDKALIGPDIYIYQDGKWIYDSNNTGYDW